MPSHEPEAKQEMRDRFDSMASLSYSPRIDKLRISLARRPESASSHFSLAQALLEANPKSNAEALGLADSGLALDPNNSWGHRLRSAALREMGIPARSQEALAAAREAARLSPGDPTNQVALLEAQLSCRNLEEGRQTVIRLMGMRPDWPSTFIEAGRWALAARQFGNAEGYFREALRLDPQNWLGMNNLGVAFQRRGQHKEAMNAFQTAAKMNPEAALPQNNLHGAIGRQVGAVGGQQVAFRLLLIGVLVPAALPVLIIVIAIQLVVARIRMRTLHPSLSLFMAYRSGQNRARRSLEAFCIWLATIMVFPIIGWAIWPDWGGWVGTAVSLGCTALWMWLA